MRRRHRVPFSDIARSITGISTPIFGVSWTPPENTRDIVRRLVAFLEDRRALYAEYRMEYGPWVNESVIQIRSELTRVLQASPEETNLTEPIRAMRAACRKFLNDMGHPGKLGQTIAPYRPQDVMYVALGELRAIFGLHLARLCAAYGVDVEPELAWVLPEPDEDDE